MAERTGYNVRNIKTLMENIEECYNNLGTTVQNGWETVKATLRQNWVGEDEQDYETKLGERIQKMCTNTFNLTNNSLETIYSLAKAWYDFQNKNTLDGNYATGSVSFGLQEMTVSDISTNIIVKDYPTIGDDADRGLVSDNSAETVKQALVDYQKNIQAKIAEMIDAVTVDTAFFGGQAYNIKYFVDKVGTAMGEVVTAIKDMYTALDTLANKSYSDASSKVSGDIYNAAHSVESNMADNLGAARWTSDN